MRRTLLALLVLLAIMLGAGAAGTPVNGDPSVAATTAGINLGHTVQATQKVEAAPSAELLGARLLGLLMLLAVSGWATTLLAVDERDRSLLWWERRLSRGPPAARA